MNNTAEREKEINDIINMVTMAGITFEDDDGSQIFFEVIAAFADPDSDKVYFVCSEEDTNAEEVAFFYHLDNQVNAVEDDDEFYKVGTMFENWLAEVQ